MTSPVRIPMTDLQGGPRKLEPAEAHYLTRVRRLRAGDSFTAFDPAARLEADGVVVSMNRGAIRCDLSEPRTSSRLPTRPVVLLHGLGKGDKPEQSIRAATALGATRIVFLLTERAVARSSSGSRQARWRAIALDAARQSTRGDVPELLGPLPFRDGLAAVADGLCVLLDAEARAGLAERLRVAGLGRRQPVSVLIGPEGGLSPVEHQYALQAGFVAARLGPFVLRTELAAVAALGAIAACSGDVMLDPSR